MKLCNIIKNDVAAIFGGYKSLYTPPPLSTPLLNIVHILYYLRQ